MTAQIIQFKAKTINLASNIGNEVQYHYNSYAGNAICKNDVVPSQHKMDVADKNWGKLGKEDMRCRTCDELDSKLQDFIDGEVDEISRQRLMLHLNTCEGFREKMEQYQNLKMTASSIKDSVIYDSSMGSRLRSRLNQELGLKLKFR